MLKYLPSKQKENDTGLTNALSARLRVGPALDQQEHQLRLDGHTGYCHAFLVDAIMGELLAEYASNSALPFGWRNPLPVHAAPKLVEIGPTMSQEETLAQLNRMLSSVDSQTVEQWNSLKAQLDRDRTSDRKLFDA